MAKAFRLVFIACLCLILKTESCLKDKELLTSERWKEISVANVLARAPELKDIMQRASSTKCRNIFERS